MDRQLTARSRRSEWVYSVAQFSDARLVRGELIRTPGSLVHAKRTGTLRTVCGQVTATWFKLWDVPFGSVLGNRCPACVEAVEPRPAAPSPRP